MYAHSSVIALVLTAISISGAFDWEKIVDDMNIGEMAYKSFNVTRTKRTKFPLRHISVVFVFDTNINVSQAALSCATTDALELVTQVNMRNTIKPNGTNVGIVTYDTEAQINLELPRGNSLPAIHTAMNNLQPIGGKNRRERGMNKAFLIVKKYAPPNSYKLVVAYVHDPSVPITAINVSSVMRAYGINIVVVTFGPNYDPFEALGMVNNVTRALYIISCPK